MAIQNMSNFFSRGNVASNQQQPFRPINSISNMIPNPIDQRNAEVKIIERVYLRGELLGQGGQASCYEVKTCHAIDHSGKKKEQKFACKIIEKTLLDDERQKRKVERELKIHKNLKHPYIVDFKHFFEDDQNIYILLELCERKSLWDLILYRREHARIKGVKEGYRGLAEIEIRYYMSQILQAVEYMHSNELKVIHKDLSMKNIFIGFNDDKTMQVKIGDFGMSIKLGKFQKEEISENFCGTYYFIAPEIYKSIDDGVYHYTPLCDTWAVGITLFTLLTGQEPFGYNLGNKVEPNMDNFFDFYSSRTEIDLPPDIEEGDAIKHGYSQEVRHLCRQLLQIDPKKRPQTISEILKHPFFVSKPIIPQSLPISTFERPLNTNELLHINEQFINQNLQQISLKSSSDYSGSD